MKLDIQLEGMDLEWTVSTKYQEPKGKTRGPFIAMKKQHDHRSLGYPE